MEEKKGRSLDTEGEERKGEEGRGEERRALGRRGESKEVVEGNEGKNVAGEGIMGSRENGR